MIQPLMQVVEVEQVAVQAVDQVVDQTAMQVAKGEVMLVVKFTAKLAATYRNNQPDPRTQITQSNQTPN